MCRGQINWVDRRETAMAFAGNCGGIQLVVALESLAICRQTWRKNALGRMPHHAFRRRSIADKTGGRARCHRCGVRRNHARRTLLVAAAASKRRPDPCRRGYLWAELPEICAARRTD